MIKILKRIIKLFLTILLIFNQQYGLSQDCDRIDTLFLFESVDYEKQLKQGKILSPIVDTIQQVSIYNEFAWRIEETFDTIEKRLNLQLLLDQSYFCYDWSIKERNIYAIELSRFDSIFVEGEFTDNIDTLNNSIIEFITNPNDKYNLPQKRVEYINFFDTVFISKHGFFINAVMIADSNNNSSSWKDLHKIINTILSCYIDLRNDLSKAKWNVSYKKLDFEKKCAVSSYYPINIWIFPNRERIKPPPPPPYEQTEQYIIDSITNSYMDELIEKLFKNE